MLNQNTKDELKELCIFLEEIKSTTNNQIFKEKKKNKGYFINENKTSLIKRVEDKINKLEEALKEYNDEKEELLTLNGNKNQIKKNIKRQYFSILSENPAAFDILKSNRDDIDWRKLSKNTNPELWK